MTDSWTMAPRAGRGGSTARPIDHAGIGPRQTGGGAWRWYTSDVRVEAFQGGATYQTLLGDPQGGTPIRIGIQSSPPGYATPLHSHPYLETITVLEGLGEAWLQGNDARIELRPGVTLVIDAHQRHWFRAMGDRPLKTYGVHASPHRILILHEEISAVEGPAGSARRHPEGRTG
jgi:quercetin dioxygenase-like cupin family protein